MTINAQFAHINIVAEDWHSLARFYQQVFGCTPAPPPRDLAGAWLDRVTGLEGAHLEGVHLRLPGCGDRSPTLEIFAYARQVERSETAPNRPGFAHIAFAVENVEDAFEAVLSAGGGTVGEIVSTTIPGAGRITLAYVTDPEGNIVELQQWAQGSPGSNASK